MLHDHPISCKITSVVDSTILEVTVSTNQTTNMNKNKIK